MKKTMEVKLPIDVLWEFREFKRDEVPLARHSFMTTHNVEEVQDFIHMEGKVEPIELSIIGARALLTDGNHRIVAAKRLGYTIVPVTLVLFIGGAPDTFYDHTLKRFKPISRHLELFLRKIFLN